MMKRLFVAGLVGLAMGACQEPFYTIKGTVDVPSLEGAKVYLATGGWAAEHPRMDSTVVADGKYVFKGKVAEPECAWVKLVDGRNPQNPVYANLALENAEIRIHTDAEGWSEISGTAANDAYQRFSSAKRVPRRAMDTLRKRIQEESAARTLDPEREKAMKATWAKHSQELRAITFDSIKCHINNPAFWNDLYVCAASHPLAEQKELLAGANARTLEVPAVKKVQELIATLERTDVGKPFIDIRMSDPEGKEVALSDYAGKGKYVLVDFWASWCVPCVEELPNLKAAYAAYKDKGLDIVGVSMDTKKKAWLDAIDKYDLPWHHMSSLDIRGREVRAQYGINGIPYLILLDPDGIIVARGLRGAGLQEKLAELIGK